MIATAGPPRRRALLASTFLACALAAGCSSSPTQAPQRALRQGAVVSEHPLATRVGIEVLARGGNAADAAVATALALAVVYPQAGNLGGGGFALWVPARGEARALDFREEAPRGARPEAYLDAEGRVVAQRSLRGPLAVGVPGSPRGLHELHRQLGSRNLEFHELVQPAIELARQGFFVDAFLARDLAQPGLRERMDEAARRVFFPRGEALREGDLLVQPELASTLAAYASRGPALFHGGRIADAIVRAVEGAALPDGGRAPAGWMTIEDLRAYEPRWLRPLRGSFRGYELFAMPPPSSGGIVLLQVLGMLEGLPLESERLAGRSRASEAVSERMAHWWIEALRRAFADRAAYMGDRGSMAVGEEVLLSPAWIAAQRVSIGERADLEVGPQRLPPAPESPQTTHLSVVDRSGNALSLTTTLNESFGSGILVEGGGFLLNNELDDFAIQVGQPNLFGLVGGEANAIAPGKRPLSSMCPTVVRGRGGELVLVLGSPGGPRIITAVLQVLLRVLVLEQPVEDALRAPRLHQQWRPPQTRFEDSPERRWPPELLEALRARGHPIELGEQGLGSVQAIGIDPDGGVRAVSDPRRGGRGELEPLRR